MAEQNQPQAEKAQSLPLTEAEKEQFLTNWAERMPEVLEWSDEEILSGILTGM